jgi:hypothetical protein
LPGAASNGCACFAFGKYDEFGRVTNKLAQLSAEILRYKYDADNPTILIPPKTAKNQNTPKLGQK